MTMQERVNLWCNVGAKLGKTPNLADTLWRFDVELERHETTKAAIIEMYERWYYGEEPVTVLPVVVAEMT